MDSTPSELPVVSKIILHKFMNHEHTEIPLSPEGVTIVFGPNGVGKSAIQEAASFLFSDSQSSRFTSWKDAFLTGSGYVEVVITDAEGKMHLFRKNCVKGRYDCYWNDKKVSASDFQGYLLSQNIAFNKTTMISQGEISQKFKGSNKIGLRSMIEDITGDKDMVVLHKETLQKLDDLGEKGQDLVKKISLIRGDLTRLEASAKIVIEHDQKMEEINELEQQITAGKVLECQESLAKFEPRRMLRQRIESRFQNTIQDCENHLVTLGQDLEHLGKERESFTEKERSMAQEKDSLLQLKGGHNLKLTELQLQASDYKTMESELLKSQESQIKVQSDIEKIMKEFPPNSDIEALTTQNLSLLKNTKEEIEKLTTFIKNTKGIKIDLVRQEEVKKKHQEIWKEHINVLEKLDALQNQEKQINTSEKPRLPLFDTVEHYAKTHNWNIKGPACFLFRLKSNLDVETRDLLRRAILQVAGNKMGAYFVDTEEDMLQGNKYKRHPKSPKELKIFYVDFNQQVTLPKVPRGALDYLVNYLEIPPELRIIGLAVLNEVLVAEDERTAFDLAKRGYSVVSLDGMYYFGTKYFKDSAPIWQEQGKFEDYFGMDDPKIAAARLQGIRVQIKNLKTETTSLAQEKKKMSDQLDEMKVQVEASQLLPQREKDLTIQKALLESLQKKQEFLDQTVKGFSALKSSKTSIDSNAERLQKGMEIFKQREALMARLAEIEATAGQYKLNEMETSIRKIIDLKKAIELLKSALISEHGQFKRRTDEITKKIARLDQLSTQLRALLPRSYVIESIKGIDLNSLQTRQDELKNTCPSIAGLNPNAPNLLKQTQKRFKRVEDDLEKVEQQREGLKKQLKDVENEWAIEFKKKIKKIEDDTNNFIEFLGLKISLELNSTDIRDAVLSLKVNTPQGMLEQHMLSGGQKSLINLCLFLGANYYSALRFFLLDEMDQNLDPFTTESASQLLHKFSQKKQVLLLSPGKDPFLLRGTTPIYLACPSGKLEVINIAADEHLNNGITEENV